jgi:protein-disulfide isomerase
MNKRLFRSVTAISAAVGLTLAAVSLPAYAEISEKDFAAAMDKYLKTDAGAEKVGSTLESYFVNKQQDAKKKEEDLAKAEIENQFKNPVKIDIGKSPVTGPANAKVTIIEFSDFQCPFCSRGRNTMEEVLKQYPNDVKVAFKHYPLPFHNEAEPAARASWAAQQQGKFWEFHDALFKNQDKLGTDFYLATAKELKLDVEKFKTDMNSEAAKQQVKEDMDLGSKNGIRGTPGFFVNGVAVKGAYPAEHFRDIINRWLKGQAAPTK